MLGLIICFISLAVTVFCAYYCIYKMLDFFDRIEIRLNAVFSTVSDALCLLSAKTEEKIKEEAVKETSVLYKQALFKRQKDLSKRSRIFRRANNLSQRAACKQIGISATYFSMFENNNSVMAKHWLDMIEAYLDKKD